MRRHGCRWRIKPDGGRIGTQRNRSFVYRFVKRIANFWGFCKHRHRDRDEREAGQIKRREGPRSGYDVRLLLAC